MLTDPVAILQEIIEQNGDCDSFAGPAVCKRCPLGGKRIDDRRVNCMDYLRQSHNIDRMSEDELKATYKAAAEEELFTIELENLLK